MNFLRKSDGKEAQVFTLGGDFWELVYVVVVIFAKI